jgi:polar amino acid transport system permease protein
MRSFGPSDAVYLINAAQWTVYLSLFTFFLGGAAGFVVALARASANPVKRMAAGAYIQIFQNTPLLMQLLLVYFGLSLLGLRLPSLVAAAIALTFFSSAFLGDIWRGCIEATPRQQFEAADALALTPWQRTRYVVLPQATRLAIPPTVGFFVQIVKNTSLTSIVGMTELMRAANTMNNATFQPIRVFGVASLIYFALCFPLSLISRRLEARINAGR